MALADELSLSLLLARGTRFGARFGRQVLVI